MHEMPLLIKLGSIPAPRVFDHPLFISRFISWLFAGLGATSGAVDGAAWAGGRQEPRLLRPTAGHGRPLDVYPREQRLPGIQVCALRPRTRGKGGERTVLTLWVFAALLNPLCLWLLHDAFVLGTGSTVPAPPGPGKCFHHDGREGRRSPVGGGAAAEGQSQMAVAGWLETITASRGQGRSIDLHGQLCSSLPSLTGLNIARQLCLGTRN